MQLALPYFLSCVPRAPLTASTAPLLPPIKCLPTRCASSFQSTPHATLVGRYGRLYICVKKFVAARWAHEILGVEHVLVTDNEAYIWKPISFQRDIFSPAIARPAIWFADAPLLNSPRPMPIDQNYCALHVFHDMRRVSPSERGQMQACARSVGRRLAVESKRPRSPPSTPLQYTPCSYALTGSVLLEASPIIHSAQQLSRAASLSDSLAPCPFLWLSSCPLPLAPSPSPPSPRPPSRSATNSIFVRQPSRGASLFEDMGFFYHRSAFREYWDAVEAAWHKPFYDAVVDAYDSVPKCLQASNDALQSYVYSSCDPAPISISTLQLRLRV